VPPNVGISSPPGFAVELARAVGPFETVGWPEMTNPVKDSVLSDRAFLDHVRIVMAQREARLRHVLARDDWDLVFALFSEPDRVQHVLYRHIDPLNPLHDPEVAPEFAGEIDRAYEEMDRIVGETLAAVPAGTHVVVCSDHGFAPFRRGVNLNNFLMSHGLQQRFGASGPRGVQDLGSGELFSDVDWPRTKAYSMGLGNVYLNLAGREREGTVALTDAEAVLEDVRAKLLALRDVDGARVVREVYRGSDLYHGPRTVDAPDLVVGFERGYRVSWQTCLGACDEDVITPNMQPWSGDHCSVDPSLVPGVLFTSFPLVLESTPHVEDVGPTVLGLFGLAGPSPDGRSLLSER
jgi:predicted AlkP superfamily phosphohydrolase/phosphomutase